MRKNSVIFGSLAIVVAALLWSLDGTFLRPKLYSVSSPLVVFLEHALGLIVLLPFLIIYRGDFKLISRKQWGTIFWVALFGGALGTTFFTKALFLTGFTDISVVILLQKFQPIFALILAAIFLRERFPSRFYLLAGLALLAGYFVTFRDPWTVRSVFSTTGAIAGFSLLAAFAWGSSTAFGKYSLRNINFGLLAALRFGFTVLIMALPAYKYFDQLGGVTGAQWGVFATIVFSSGAVAMFVYYFGLKRVTASLSTLLELAWPLSAIFLDYALNKNVLSWTQILGAIVLVGSVTYLTWLNRPRTLTGTVLAGHNQGEKVGARTANLDLGLAKLLPKGLYLSRVQVEGVEHQALLYYGINSLTNKDCLEVHLLDFNGDLYGKTVSVTTEQYLRFPKKFTTAEQLAVQIRKDLQAVEVVRS